MHKRKILVKLSIIVGLLFLIWVILMLNAVYNTSEIKKIAHNLKEESVDDLDFINKSMWETFDRITIKGWQTPKEGKLCSWIYPCLRIKDTKNAQYILKTKYGRCGEHAILLSAILKEGGVTSIVADIYRKGKANNHAWNHVLTDDGRFLIRDASSPKREMNISKESYPNSNVLHVTGHLPDDTNFDMTELYTRASNGKLIVDYTNTRKYFSNGYISFHWENEDISGIYTLPESGVAEFNFAGNYTYQLRVRSKLYFHYVEKEFNITRGNITLVKLDGVGFDYFILLKIVFIILGTSFIISGVISIVIKKILKNR